MPQTYEDTSLEDAYYPPEKYFLDSQLQVGTFNIDWLWADYDSDWEPRNEVDYQMISELFEWLDVEIFGLQEINTIKALDLLNLPDNYDYITGTTGWSQNLAIVWKTDRVSVSNVRELELSYYVYPDKQPLLADVVSLNSGFEFTLMVLHLDAFTDYESASARNEQTAQIHSWIDNRLETGELTSLVVLGDLNDTFEGLNTGFDPLQVFEDDSRFYCATKDTDEGTTLYYESKIDHIFMAGDILERYSSGSIEVFRHDDEPPFSNYSGGHGNTQHISSHRPVFVYLEDLK